MDNSFFIISEKNSIANFSSTLRRRELINNICENQDFGYKTQYPHIVKLCRTCINDICKQLIQLANWETTRFKKYSELLQQINEGTYITNDIISLKQDLEINITDAKFLHNKYYSTYQKLKNMKLYTKSCYVCQQLHN